MLYIQPYNNVWPVVKWVKKYEEVRHGVNRHERVYNKYTRTRNSYVPNTFCYIQKIEVDYYYLFYLPFLKLFGLRKNTIFKKAFSIINLITDTWHVLANQCYVSLI